MADLPTPQALLDLKLSRLRLQLAVHFDCPKTWTMYMPSQIAPFPSYPTLLPERGLSVCFYSGGKPDSKRLERYEIRSNYPVTTMPLNGSRMMFELVDNMRIEEAARQKAIGLANTARAKHAGDSWLADIMEEYELLMEEGECHMCAAKYDKAVEVYIEAAKALVSTCTVAQLDLRPGETIDRL